MLGKRLSLPLGAALLAALAFGPGQVAQASAGQAAPQTVLSAPQDAATNAAHIVKARHDPDRERRQRRWQHERRHYHRHQHRHYHYHYHYRR
jgi:hypothetical protein